MIHERERRMRMSENRIRKATIINDNEVAQYIFKLSLQKANFASELTQYFNGKEALDDLLLEKEKGHIYFPEVIFLDLGMPVMNGWEFMEEYEKLFYPHFQATRIVIISASMYKEDIERSMQYPFVLEFLNKSISKDYLIDLKQRLIDEI